MKLLSSLKRAAGIISGSIEKGWTFKAGSNIVGGISIGDLEAKGRESIVFGTSDGIMHAIDSRSMLKWTFKVESKLSEKEKLFLEAKTPSAITQAPLLHDINKDGKLEVVFGCDDGFVYCLDCMGKFLWSFYAGSPVRSRPEAADIDGHTTIIIGADSCKLHMLDYKGKEMSSFDAESEIRGSPSVLHTKSEHRIVFGTEKGYLYCINIKGVLRWKFKAAHAIETKPLIADFLGHGNDSIAVGSFDGHVYMIDSNGNLEWKYGIEGSITSDVAAADINHDGMKEIVFGGSDGSVHALSPNGNKIWSFSSGMWVVAQPEIGDMNDDKRYEVIFGSFDHNVYFLDAEGKFLTNYTPGFSSFTSELDNYSEMLTEDPGTLAGKMIWSAQVDGKVTGVRFLKEKDENKIIVSTLNGAVNELRFRD